jgi:signal transduction histidine kinase
MLRLRLRLRNKLLLFSIILALIPIGIAGQVLIQNTQDELKSLANEEVRLVAEQLTQEIDSLVNNSWLRILRLLRASLDNPGLSLQEKRAIVDSIKEMPDLVALQITVEGLEKPVLFIQNHFAQRLQQAGLNPTDVLRLSPQKAAKYLRAGHIFMGDVNYLSQTDDWLLTVALPLINPIQGAQSMLSAKIDLRGLRKRIETHPFHLTGSIMLLDGQGHQIFAPDRPDLKTHELARAARARLSSDTRVAVAFPYTRPNGEHMLGAYGLSRYIEWAVLVEREEATAYLAIDKMKQNLLFWVSMGLIGAVIGAFVFSRRISRPILEIGAVSQSVGQGQFSARVKEVKSTDEIAELGRQINQMIDGLAERERIKGENLLFRQLINRLKKLNEQKNKFLGMAAHDLRNPIGAILGYSEMLLEEDLHEEDRRIVAQIETSSKFMLHLLNDLLDISQIESGKLELNRQKTNLISLVSDNVELNRIIAGKKNITIHFNTHEDIPQLEVDPSKLRQVLNNLTSNAIKFSHPNTTIKVALINQGDHVCFSVKDQGQGIPAHEIQHVFKEFRKTSVKSTAGEKSSGLGLAIVKKIVEGHGGTIGVESQVGKGSIFYVTLPTQQKQIQKRANTRKEERLETYLPVQFSMAMMDTGTYEGMGTSLDLSASGMLIESTVQLRVNEEIYFTLQLPGTLVIGIGRLVRQILTSRYGVQFESFQADGQQRIQRFLSKADEISVA